MPSWEESPKNQPESDPREKNLYYVVYPDPKYDRAPPPFPSPLYFEAFENIDDARAHCKKLDTGHPARDFLVFKGPIIGSVLDDAFQEF